MASWKFDKNGNIDDGLGNMVKFSEIVKFDPNTKTVKKIDGESVPISVSDADSVTGIPGDKLAKKELIPISTSEANLCLSADIEINKLDFETVNYKAMFEVVGQETKPDICTIGTELLPNVTFDNTDNIAIVNDANISVTNNTLRVNAESTDYPAAEMTFKLTKDKFYIVLCNLGGATPAITITGPNNKIVLPKYTINGVMVKSILATESGDYKFKMSMDSTADDDTAMFSNVSIKEINIANLSIGDYFTYDDTTYIETGMKSSDIMYNPDREYSNKAGNNLAFFYDDFNMLEYINTTPGLSGLIKETLVNNAGEYVGGFDKATDLDSYNIIGNTVKNITNDNLVITRSALGGDLEIYINIDTIVGKEYIYSFDVIEVSNQWWSYIDTKEIKIVNSNDTLTDCVTRNIVFKATKTTSKIKFICKNNDNADILQINNIKLQELDNTVWVNVTPIDIDSETKVYSWDTINDTVVDQTNVKTISYISDFSTLYGTYAINKFILEDARHIQLYKRYDSLKEFGNNYIKLGFYKDACNAVGHTLRHTVEYYDKLVLHRDIFGKLQLTAYNDTINSGITLFQGSGVSGQKLFKGYEANTKLVIYKPFHSPGEISWLFMKESNNSNDCIRCTLNYLAPYSLVEHDNCAKISINNNDLAVNTTFNNLYNVGLVKHYGESEFIDTLYFTGGTTGDIKTLIEKDNYITEIMSLCGKVDVSYGNVFSSTSIDDFKSYRFLDYIVGSIALDELISISNTNDKSILSVTSNNAINRPNILYHTVIFSGNNRDINGITITRPKRDPRLYSVDGVKVILKDIVDERGIVNKIEKLDSSSINNITKANLK